MRPTCSARSLASLSRRRQPPLSIPNRLLHSSPRLSSEVVPSPTIAADSSSSSSSSASNTSSTSTSPAWPRPVPEGKLEAYDLALEFLRARQAKVEAKRSQAEAASSRQGAYKRPTALHDPEARWLWQQGFADPTLPSSVYFERERFELKGGLDLHEARINQMHVVPDVAMVDKLLLDFGFKFPPPPPAPAPEPDQYGIIRKVRPYQTRDATDGNRVLCGARLTVKETLSQPELEIRHFGDGKETDRYTLFLLDLDVPKVDTHSFQEKIHWMVPNLTIDPSTRIFPSPDIPLSPSTKHVSHLPEPLHAYLPPHPHMGTDTHRYTFLLVRHDRAIPFGEEGVAIPPRDGFSFRAWEQGLKDQGYEVQVAGMSFFRETYDKVICPQIWTQLICQPELKFIVDKDSNRLYLDRWGKNKADVLHKKKVFEARNAANALLSEADLASAKLDRREELASQGLSTAEIDQMEKEDADGVWHEKVFAEDDSTVANATGEKKIVSAVVEVETEKPVESAEEAEEQKPVLRRWRRGVLRRSKDRTE